MAPDVHLAFSKDFDAHFAFFVPLEYIGRCYVCKIKSGGKEINLVNGIICMLGNSALVNSSHSVNLLDPEDQLVQALTYRRLLPVRVRRLPQGGSGRKSDFSYEKNDLAVFTASNKAHSKPDVVPFWSQKSSQSSYLAIS